MTRTSRFSVALAALGAGLALAACAPSGQNADGRQGKAQAGAARTIATFDGTSVTVPVAGKPTAVYFFATGCASCIPPLQAMAKIARTQPEVVYLPVSLNPYDDKATIEGFLTAAGDHGRAAALDGQARLAAALGVTSLGTLIVYNNAGTEIYRGVDPTEDALAAAFAKAAGQ